MKIITYYLLLLIFIGLLAGYMLQGRPDGMSMQQMVSVSLLLGVYVVGLSLAGEGQTTDERAILHRYTANRGGLLAGTIVISLGVLYQLFVQHHLDPWLLAGLIAINLVKIMVLIYANYNK